MIFVRIFALFLLSLTMAATLLVGPAVSEITEAEAEAAAQQIFNELNSPFCPGRLLRDCPSSGAGDLKDKVRAKFQSGASKGEVRAWLLENYGEDIDPLPSAKGFGLVAWLAPLLFLLLGGLGIVFFLRSLLKREE